MIGIKDSMSVAIEVRRLRQFIDAEIETMGRDVLRRSIHQMLDRVCDAADDTYAENIKQLERQAGVMAETAKRNVRLEASVKNLVACVKDALETFRIESCFYDDINRNCEICDHEKCPAKKYVAAINANK